MTRKTCTSTVISAVCWFSSVCLCVAAERAAILAARNSIVAGDLKRHVDYLSDDTFEGREAGSRGGRAAAGYLMKEFQRHGLAGGASEQSYDQTFDRGYRNLLGLWEGSDPVLKHEVVLIGAHYDHVGYGNASNSYGPIGYIHNGADDNASGTAGLLELVQAIVQLEPRPKRTLLFALWDGEEKGLLGSKHWTDRPTLPLSRVKFALNMDMIGRLRNDRVEVYGARTAAGFRELLSRQNGDAKLFLDFSWEMKDDSDHYSFFEKRIPTLMLFTGLHDQYHRPSDDAHTVDHGGAERVTRTLFNLILDVADRPELPAFRDASTGENPSMQKAREQAAPPMPGRLGIAWDATEEKQAIRVTKIVSGSSAERGGLRVGDRLLRFAGEELADGEQLRSLVLTASNPVSTLVQRPGTAEPVEFRLHLAGSPVRLGVTWRLDDAEPGVPIVNRVVPASPAAAAGLRVNDRLMEIGGERIDGEEGLRALLAERSGDVTLTVERGGRLIDATAVVPEAGGR